MRKSFIDLSIEQFFWQQGCDAIAGVDEAGRGPLAGPVCAAAVMFHPGTVIEGVDDSKKLSPHRREELYKQICDKALSIGVGIVTPELIDKINILEATMLAMSTAVSKLTPSPSHLLIDGPRYINTDIPFTTIVNGDATCFSIAAASIIAKVTRDRWMIEVDKHFPQYGFAKNKGYGTKEHRQAIQKYGPCAIHRRSFRLLPTRREER